MEQQMSLREDQMTELEKRMYNIRQDHDGERRHWGDKVNILSVKISCVSVIKFTGINFH